MKESNAVWCHVWAMGGATDAVTSPLQHPGNSHVTSMVQLLHLAIINMHNS